MLRDQALRDALAHAASTQNDDVHGMRFCRSKEGNFRQGCRSTSHLPI
ncbi:hypothetical protein VITFI_CDS0248 [Vitreoscilla filiformis]|uniref:Uncharacterized protein n=1 Tax=Vitreoscilla filiformis TaxID=63 RepID=A0A221KB11_VITFI|nr:hypothetical protein VITFI_CDS0248 [Vitreoscilla filiformis]